MGRKELTEDDFIVEPLSDTDLSGLSATELKAFVDSPYWRIMVGWMKEDIAANERDILAGDIALRMAGERGMKYRSNDALRGGIIGMSGLLRYPVLLFQEIQTYHESLDKEKTNE